MKLIIYYSILLLGIIAVFTFGIAEEFYIKGEIVNAWTVMTERAGQAFTISSATMEVLGDDSAVWQAETDASISSGQVWCLVDTTFTTFTAGNRGHLKFKYTVSPETMIFKVPIKIYE